jgi:DNA polymerase III subunit delta
MGATCSDFRAKAVLRLFRRRQAMLSSLMAQKKAFEVDAWLARPGEHTAIVLVYGPDRGLVSERARAFAVQTGLPLDDPFSVVVMDAAEIEQDQGRLVDEARTVPMFSPKRLLWVRNAGAQKGLAEQVKLLCAEPPGDAIILIEAAELKKGVALRASVEASGAAMALPCYADGDRDVEGLIESELTMAGMTISPDARQVLRRSLGGDRLASRGEITKLVLFAHGKNRIELEDVQELTGDVSGLSVDDAIDSMLEGRVEAFDAVFTRQSLNGSQAYQVLASAIRHMQAIQLMRAGMDAGNRNAAALVAAARPPIFFARRKTFEKAVERWSGAALQRALARLQSAVLATRRRPDLAVAIARQALLGIAIESARAGRTH